MLPAHQWLLVPLENHGRGQAADPVDPHHGKNPDLQSLHLHVMDHDLTTLSRCTVGLIPHDALRTLTRERPTVAEALWRETLIDAAVFREWIGNVGRRAAVVRLAHLLAEIGTRLQAMDLAPGDRFE